MILIYFSLFLITEQIRCPQIFIQTFNPITWSLWIDFIYKYILFRSVKPLSLFYHLFYFIGQIVLYGAETWTLWPWAVLASSAMLLSLCIHVFFDLHVNGFAIDPESQPGVISFILVCVYVAVCILDGLLRYSQSATQLASCLTFHSATFLHPHPTFPFPLQSCTASVSIKVNVSAHTLVWVWPANIQGQRANGGGKRGGERKRKRERDGDNQSAWAADTCSWQVSQAWSTWVMWTIWFPAWAAETLATPAGSVKQHWSSKHPAWRGGVAWPEEKKRLCC